MEKKKRILVVDDDGQICKLLREVLDRGNYETFFCANGAIALEIIQEECFIPHLILTDWEMPVMNGLELIKKVKAEIPQLPTILMTGKPELLPNKISTDAILKKPFNIVELMNCVQQLIL